MRFFVIGLLLMPFALAQSPADLEAVKRGTGWLGRWWTSGDEITTALCGLAAGSIDRAEGQGRLNGLVRELPNDGALCSSAGTPLWKEALRRQPWLGRLQRERCAAASSTSSQTR